MKICMRILLLHWLLVVSLHADTPKVERLFAWSMSWNEASVRQAADCGVTDAAFSGSPTAASRTVELGNRYQYRVFGIVAATGNALKICSPACAAAVVQAPIQQVSTAETMHFARLRNRWTAAGSEPGDMAFQTAFGGAPQTLPDGIAAGISCWGAPYTSIALEAAVDAWCAVPELSGIAFDFIGYCNLQRCRCADCHRRSNQYRHTHSGSFDAEFHRAELIRIYRTLTARIRRQRPDFAVTAHLYPVFLLDPLFGRELGLDFCQETAARYMPWPEEKIASYTAKISAYPGGMPFIGYYDHARRPVFPLKTPEHVARELDMILAAGGRTLGVCSFADVLGNPAVFAEFKKRCAGNPASVIDPSAKPVRLMINQSKQ